MTYPVPASSVGELLDALSGIARVDGGRLVIDDESAFRERGVDMCVWSATFSEDHQDVIDVARWMIWEASQLLGSPSASIHDLYMARGRGEVNGFTVPAVNIRTQVFDMAGAMCRAAAVARFRNYHLRARPERAGVHLPAARRVHHQRPRRLHRGRLAGPGLRPGRPLPVQRQEVRRRSGGDDRGNRRLIREALESATATSTSTRRRWSTCRCRRSTSSSARTTSAPPSCRRSSARSSPPSMTISIGGEIGEVGKQNSTEEELRAYLDGYRARARRARRVDAPGLSKVSVQTGTSHGGVPLAGRRRGRGDARLRHARATLGRRARVRTRRCRSARRVDAARRAFPPLPAGRDG